MKKKVTFCESKNKVYRMHTWTYAYRQSRRSDWEEKMLDAIRFKDRIRKVSQLLEKYLNVDYRLKIYRERFCQC